MAPQPCTCGRCPLGRTFDCVLNADLEGKLLDEQFALEETQETLDQWHKNCDFAQDYIDVELPFVCPDCFSGIDEMPHSWSLQTLLDEASFRGGIKPLFCSTQQDAETGGKGSDAEETQEEQKIRYFFEDFAPFGEDFEIEPTAETRNIDLANMTDEKYVQTELCCCDIGTQTMSDADWAQEQKQIDEDLAHKKWVRSLIDVGSIDGTAVAAEPCNYSQFAAYENIACSTQIQEFASPLKKKNRNA